MSGVVTYSNQAKCDILKIPAAVIERHGAVSPETAEAMAKSIRKLANTDIGVSTTGIAGPDGGSLEKPVGLVYIGISTAKHTYSKRFVFTKYRLLNKERSVQTVLRLLLDELNNGFV
jgi:nicotinamide-nucleotide amidase